MSALSVAGLPDAAPPGARGPAPAPSVADRTGGAPAAAPWAGQQAEGGPVIFASASWPMSPADQLPAIPGFVTSSFSPLVAELADRCLRSYFGDPPAARDLGSRTAVLLVSSSGDIATAAAVASAVDAGRRVPPLLFFQSNPNAAAGYVAARWGLAGPVVCTMPAGDALADAHRSALLLLADADADAVLVILAEQAPAAAGGDHGLAQLVGPSSWPPGAAPPEALSQPGQVTGLVNGRGF
jgi:3-oxoacyl-(acyl-carrier-protein) synthase